MPRAVRLDAPALAALRTAILAALICGSGAANAQHMDPTSNAAHDGDGDAGLADEEIIRGGWGEESLGGKWSSLDNLLDDSLPPADQDDGVATVVAPQETGAEP